MNDQTSLLNKREELRRQLAAGKYRTLIDAIFDGTSRLIQKLTRNPQPIPFWYAAVVFGLFALFVSFLTSLILGEPGSQSYRPILQGLSLIGLTLVFATLVKIVVGTVLSELRDNILSALESVADLADLERWLAGLSSVKWPLLFGLAFGVIFGAYYPIIDSAIYTGMFGVTVLRVIYWFFGGITFYYGLHIIVLVVRLSRYQLRLYQADPSSSEFIIRLSAMLSNIIYQAAVLMAILTLINALFGVLLIRENFVLLILVGWGPLTATFLIYQYALAKIITTAKLKKLKEIQAKIEQLEGQQEMPTQEMLEHISKLMDYHDRVKATRNSALDLRAGLDFINSLLLPLIAFVLGNLKQLMALFP